MAVEQGERLQHFYINEEQSVYLLSHRDAQKLKDWLALCRAQLQRLGYSDIELLGKGAYGFAFSGRAGDGREFVFKFARINLPLAVQERLEEEGYMLAQAKHPGVPEFIEFTRVRGQSILMMARAPGINLEDYARRHGRLPIPLLLNIAAQLVEILQGLRQGRPIVHGDIKPSNLVYDEASGELRLIDWGASVFAQLDHLGQHCAAGGLAALTSEFEQSNAKLGDIYFIGAAQLGGEQSSPRFDEQGLAGTLYALASGQGSRFGSRVISPLALGLPQEFAHTLNNLLASDGALQRRAGDYLFNNIGHMKNHAMQPHDRNERRPLLPVWLSPTREVIETVVYSSRKSFLRQQFDGEELKNIDGTELEKYYKNYLGGMDDTEKAFIIAVSYLSRYPVVGGLVVHWDEGGIRVDSSIKLYDKTLAPAFYTAVNNIVQLGRAINKRGVFKSCIFDAKNTLHIERADQSQAFVAGAGMQIGFDVGSEHELRALGRQSRLHSYFEDGDDPDEMLTLPDAIMAILARINRIPHSGCIIFESVARDLKIHSYLHLLEPAAAPELRRCLDEILANLHLIDGLGVSGFMKLPDRDTKFFTAQAELPQHFYRHPRLN